MADRAGVKDGRAQLLADRLSQHIQKGTNRTLGDRAFATLHDAIVRGVLEPGQRLPIEELAEVLDMSPMPIREALRRLDAQGLAENIPHRGARVTELSLDDLRQVYEARLSLEPLAVKRAAIRLSKDDARVCQEALRLHERAIEARAADDVWATHSEFHLSLYRASGSLWLMRLITPLWQSSERYRHASGLDDWDFAERNSEHQAILDACVARAHDEAAAALHDHLATTANLLAREMGGERLFELVGGRRSG